VVVLVLVRVLVLIGRMLLVVVVLLQRRLFGWCLQKKCYQHLHQGVQGVGRQVLE
jgi:hypothetical protein